MLQCKNCLQLRMCDGGGGLVTQELLEELDVVKQNFTGFFSALRPKIESMHTTSGGAGNSPGSQPAGTSF